MILLALSKKKTEKEDKISQNFVCYWKLRMQFTIQKQKRRKEAQ